MTFNNIKEAIEDIKNGKIVVVVDDESRENEGDLIMAAEKVTPESINFMIKHGRGLICAPLSEKKTRELELPDMVKKNTDNMGTAFTVTVDHASSTTGISAFERAKTISELANPKAEPNDFLRPGHIFPLIARDGGVMTAVSQTAVDTNSNTNNNETL